MTISTGVGGSWRTVPSIKVGVSGAWRSVAAIWTGANGVWRSVSINGSSPPTGLNVAASPSSPSTFRSTAGVATTASTATASGGVAPYSYLWIQTSGGSITIGSASSASATFSANVSAIHSDVQGQFTVTATDATGKTGSTSIAVELGYVAASGGGHAQS